MTKLEFPSLIVCPKNPDTLNITNIVKDIKAIMPNTSVDTAELMIAYSIADAGFANMDSKLRFLTPETEVNLINRIKKWKKALKVKDFYKYLFNTYGYTCAEVRKLNNYTIISVL